MRRRLRLASRVCGSILSCSLVWGCAGQQQQQEEQLENSVLEEEAELNADSENSVDSDDGLVNDSGDENNRETNDLAEIISEMNLQQASEGGANAGLVQGGANGNYNQVPMNQAAGEDVPEWSNVESEGGVITGIAGVPAAPDLPEMGSKLSYIVVSGDTLGKIARRIFGNPGAWRSLAELTGLENPNQIYPGDVIYYQLTEESLAFAQAYENREQNELVVKEGDTLAGLAKRLYGPNGDWRLLWRQNGQIVHPDKIEVGSLIYYADLPQLVAQMDTAGPSQPAKAQPTTDDAQSGPALAVNLPAWQ